MATLSENLLALKQAKYSIKEAIEAKGKSLTGKTFAEYGAAIGSIQTGNPDLAAQLIDRTITRITSEDFLGTVAVSKKQLAQYAFTGCKQLEYVELPNSLTHINDYAFQKCEKLTQIVIPDTLKVIADYAFKDCIKLTEVRLPVSMTFISQGVFQNCSALINAVLPTDLSSISSYMFDGCTSLQSISIPNVKTLGVYTFRNCGSLTNIEFGNVLTEIGSYSFQGCNTLANVIIPNSTTKINTAAFQNCSSLTSVELPETPPTLVNVNAFSGINSSCVFYCKSAESLAAYQGASNWSSLSNTYTFTVKE